MARSSRARKVAPSRRLSKVGLAAGTLIVIVLGLVVVLVVRSSALAGQVAWKTFGTQDVHSLAFVNGDPQRVLFGHHGGLEESRDGGRTWSPLPVRDDAMSTSPATDGSIVIAGHDVFVASRDGGATWTPINSDLPSLDIHGFTRDPANPARMWAYLATGGLWGSTDFGVHWTRVREDNVLYPTAVDDGTNVRLLGVDVNGLTASNDGGRTWTQLALPPILPITGLAASADGSVVYAGSTGGLSRSSDGGLSWAKTGYTGSVFALATSPDGRFVAVVSRATEFFRSSDGGATWPGPP